MLQKNKTNFLFKLLACVAVFLFTLTGAIFALPSVGKTNISASAETVEYQDLLAVEDRSWGAASDEYYFGGYTLGASTDNNAHWLNTDASVNGCWYNGNNALITANNGVDILQYIYINDTSARDAITENNGALLGSSGWLTNPAASPVYVETTNGSGLLIKILKAYAGESYTLTFKAGFSLIKNDGNVLYVSDDVVYNCVGNVPTRVNKNTVTFNNESSVAVTTKRVVTGQAIGTLPEVPAKDGYVGFWTVDGVALTENTVISANKTATPVYALEYEDLLGLEDRTSWGAHEGEYYFGGVTLDPFGYFNAADSVCNTWYVGNTTPITANNGVDIMEYIYVNGTSARALITANANGDRLGNSCSCWLSNPAACPVYVETTNGSGIIIRLLKSYFGDSFTLTFKKGFSLIRNDGEVIYVSSDIVYTYENNAFTSRIVDKEYKLSFEGTDVTKTLKNNDTIGELPAVPAKDGCEGVWTIDGVEITADTAYNYGVNKTAVVTYSKNITETIGLGDWGVPETESDIRYLWIRDNNAEILTAYPNSYWNDHADNKDSNYGVDIMEYILIDGESARSIINANAAGTTSYKASSTFPLSIGGCYAPVCIETAGDGIRFKVMVDYKTSFKVTFKAGFTLVNSEGVRLYTTKDVTYKVGATMGDITAADTYVEYKDLLGLEDRTSWGAHDGEYYFGGVTLDPFGYFNTADSVCGAWYVGNTTPITANNGVDIMEYIYVNDTSARALITANANGDRLGNSCGCWLSNPAAYPVYVETTNGSGIMIRLAKAAFGDSFTLTFKAGFSLIRNDGETIYVSEDITYSYANNTLSRVEKYSLTFEGVETKEVICGQTIGELPEVPEKDGVIAAGWSIDGVEITADTVYTYGADKTAQPIYLQQYTLSFEGLDTTITVAFNTQIGELPDVPKNGDYEGVWTIDGEEITVNTVYTFNENKTATPAYSRDITKYIALEDRAWGAHDGEYYFGVLDLREENKVVSGESASYYLNSTVNGCWYHGNNALITANGGVDIMEYIYVNDTSARALITANANGSQLVNGCGCWLSNPAASPVYVETTDGSGIMIRVLQAFTGNYFEITLKSGFSLTNSAGIRVYLTEDVTYKYIVANGSTTFAKGELTDEDLDELTGQQIVLMNGGVEYLTKTTCRLTLPNITVDPVDGLEQVLVGWTTDPEELSDLYPVGYGFAPTEAVTLYAVWIGFEMQDGAAVRTSSGSSGIRFLVDIEQDQYLWLNDEIGFVYGMGVLVTPTDYLSYVSDFEHDNFPEGTCVDVDCGGAWRVGGPDAEGSENEPTWTYAAALVNISEYQYARSFSARGYLLIEFTTGVDYVYTPYVAENNARSIYEVSLSAYNDENNPAYKTNATILNYINNVANITWNTEDYLFEKTDVAGDYEITDISVAEDSYTVTVKVDGDITSAVVNGARLSSGSSSNVKMGDFIFNVSGFVKTADGFQFIIGAANTTYDKESKETLYFESSDEDLDFFLNDYFKRHSGVVENGTNLKVNSATAGVDSKEFFSHEWMSMSYYWYNSFEGYTNEQGNNSNRITGLRNFLSTVPVDDYGYVWTSNDSVRATDTEIETGEQKMGWPFPNNDTVSTAHWEFNGDDSGSWSSNVSASVSGGLYNANVSGQSSNITFTSNSFSSWSSKKIYTKYAPLLEFELRIDDATNVEDIYVWYTTSSSTSFSEDKKVSVNEKAFIAYDYSGKYEHILYLPMYAESAWGESTSTYVKQLKIEIALKSGETISGNVGLNYVRPTLDTRMSNNNSILISSLRTDYDYTGDLEYLTENITRARKAMNFLMQMYDSTRGLKKESYLVGHGGTKGDLNWLGNATADSISDSISQGYWDIMYMPEYDFQSNMYFYKAVRDLAYLEEVLANNNITVDTGLATIKTATRSRTSGTCAYNYALTSVADTVLTNLRQTTEDTNHTGFWNATNGRFVAGYASGESKWYDYGYVAWNLEAIYYGIATEEQATAIMNWLASESSLYDYVFAPRSNTVEGTDMLNGEYEAMKGDWDFGDNCQYGGAIMYTSFYDLMARIDTNGADDAFARLTAIQNWYKEVYDYYEANGSDPYDFYRYYYDNKGIQCQGLGTAGAVGLDREFLESFLPVSAVAYGFFGIEAEGDVLTVAPEKPADLTMWSMENLAFNFVKYDLTIYENAIQLNNVRGDATGLQLTVALDYTAGQTVYVNGKAVTPNKTENGKAYVTIDFGAAIVEVR